MSDGEEELNEGVKILLQRMDTNPEDFYHNMNSADRWGASPWAEMVREFSDVFTDNERAILKARIKDIQREQLTLEAMKLLLKTNELAEPAKQRSILTANMITKQAMQVLEDELWKSNQVVKDSYFVNMSKQAVRLK